MNNIETLMLVLVPINLRLISFGVKALHHNMMAAMTGGNGLINLVYMRNDSVSQGSELVPVAMAAIT